MYLLNVTNRNTETHVHKKCLALHKLYCFKLKKIEQCAPKCYY